MGLVCVRFMWDRGRPNQWYQATATSHELTDTGRAVLHLSHIVGGGGGGAGLSTVTVSLGEVTGLVTRYCDCDRTDDCDW